MTAARKRGLWPVFGVRLLTTDCLLSLLLCRGYRLIDALLAGNGGIELRTHDLDHLLGVRPIRERGRILQDGLNGLVVILPETFLPHPSVFHRAVADRSTAHGDPLYFPLRARNPANERPRRIRVRRVFRYGPVPGSEHRFSTGDF